MDDFETNGFELLQAVVAEQELNHLNDALCEHEMSGPGLRHLLTRNETIRQFASSSTLLEIAKRHLGSLASPVKAILFDKTVESNWYVTWHQDLTIAVREKIEQPGFGPWSVKDGVQHVQPPAEVLENMIAIRIHLDSCAADNGPISFIPGSHKSGKLDAEQIIAWREKQRPVSCPANQGDVIVMRPLILHSSSKASKPEHRRVLHIEYAGSPLPGGLEWNEGRSLDTVELIMAIEEEFGIDIPVRVAERMFTVGDTYDYLRIRLASVPVRECLSQKIFYKLRKALIQNYRVKRNDIEPSTMLCDVLSEQDIEAGWPYLELFVEMKTPDFRRSNELFGFKLSEDTIKKMTMRELVSRLISLNSEKFSEERATDHEIWRRLVEVIVRQLSVNREEVLPAASFSRDLGAC